MYISMNDIKKDVKFYLSESVAGFKSNSVWTANEYKMVFFLLSKYSLVESRYFIQKGDSVNDFIAENRKKILSLGRNLTIDIHEVKEILNIPNKNFSRDFEKLCQNLSIKVSNLTNPDDPKENFNYMTWFSSLKYDVKKQALNVNFAEEIFPYLIVYTKYSLLNLKYILNLKTSYSVKLYVYLKSFILKYKKQGIMCFDLHINDLKELMNTGDLYKNNFANFKKRLLDKSIANITETTDIRIEYTLSKVGQTYYKIFFTIYDKKTKAMEVEEPVSMPVESQKLTRDSALKNILANQFFMKAKAINEIIDTYGEEAINEILERMQEQAKKGNAITNRTGYLINSLKSYSVSTDNSEDIKAVKSSEEDKKNHQKRLLEVFDTVKSWKSLDKIIKLVFDQNFIVPKSLKKDFDMMVNYFEINKKELLILKNRYVIFEDESISMDFIKNALQGLKNE